MRKLLRSVVLLLHVSFLSFGPISLPQNSNQQDVQQLTGCFQLSIGLQEGGEVVHRVGVTVVM